MLSHISKNKRWSELFFIQYKKPIWIKTFMLTLIQVKFVLCIVKKLLSKICLSSNTNNSYNSSELYLVLQMYCIRVVFYLLNHTDEFQVNV